MTPREPPPVLSWYVFVRWGPGDTCCYRVRATAALGAIFAAADMAVADAPGEEHFVYAVELVPRQRARQ